MIDRPRPLVPVLTFASLVSLGALAALAALTTGCASKSPPAAAAATGKGAKPPPPPTNTKITAFAVSIENLNVDKIGLRDGFFKPDGTRDLAFTASVDGPFDALFVASVSAKGEPTYGLRADTLGGREEIPVELGGVIDTGKMTVGIGVVEDGKFVNGESGSVARGDGRHQLTLYVSNSGTLMPGSFVRMYVRAPGGALVPGPVAPY